MKHPHAMVSVICDFIPQGEPWLRLVVFNFLLRGIVTGVYRYTIYDWFIFFVVIHQQLGYNKKKSGGGVIFLV